MPKIEIKYEFTILGIIQIILLVVGGTFAYATLINGQANGAAEIGLLKPAVGSLEQVSATLNTRLTVVESRAETQAVEQRKLAEVVELMAEKLQAVGKDASDTSKDVQYIREWVRDLKEATKGAAQ